MFLPVDHPVIVDHRHPGHQLDPNQEDRLGAESPVAQVE